MATKWIARLTSFALGLAFFLIGVGLYLFWTQGRALTEANEQIARRSASVLYIDEPIAETTTFFASMKDLLKEICRSAQVETQRTACISMRNESEVLRQFNLAALARASATESSAFEQAERLYRQALALATGPGGAEWRAYAHEGIAYTLLRRGRLDDAASAISEAQKTGVPLAIVHVTDLKIRCGQGESDEGLRQRFGQVRRWAEQASATDPQLRARFNRLLADPELLFLCDGLHE